MSVRKNHEERLNEILDVAEGLFAQKGYENTTVNDILDGVGIGKGTFYHYFPSKEEVMDAIIGRQVSQFAAQATEIAGDKSLTALQKFKDIVMGQAGQIDPHADFVNELHRPSNAQMHQKSIVEMIRVLSPILADVIQQGVVQGVFHVEYPLETTEIMLVANQFLFDYGIFGWSYEETLPRAKAYVHSLEVLLGAEAGSFEYIYEHYRGEKKSDEKDI